MVPPPQTDNPNPPVTPQAALASFEATGVYSYASSYSTPTISRARFTDEGQGTSNADGTMTLAIADRPVWMITYRNVPDSPAGPAGSTQVTVIHDVVALVDSSSGVCLEVLSGIPDS
jgi:hypothetical protein